MQTSGMINQIRPRRAVANRHELSRRVPTLATAIGVLLIVASASLASATPEPPTMLVGVAKIDATPDYPVRLNGFGYRQSESEGVAQRLYVKALAFGADAKSGAILVTVDNLGVPDAITQAVAKNLEQQLGLDPARFVVTFTHTHTAPMLRGASETIFGHVIPPEHRAHVDRYTEQMQGWIEEAATQAWRAREPARVAWNVGRVTFAINRRTQGGPVDHDLPVLVVKDLNGTTRAVYTTYACHCVTLGHNQISGDWAGSAAADIEKAHPGSVALVSIGCGADSNPSSGVTQGDLQAAGLQGRMIRDEVERLLTLPMRPVAGPISAKYERLELPLVELPPRSHWEARAKAPEAHVAHHARMQLARLDRGQALRTAVSYPVQSWSFGNELAMVFLAGEVVVDYSLRLKREFDANHLWLHAYSNDFPFYIPSERILKEGGYEGGDSLLYFDMPARFAPGLEEKIIDAVHRQLGAKFKSAHDANRTGGTWPLSPERSLAEFRTKPGLKIELVAAEPLVVDPVAIDFGPDGRLWVAEMHDYPTGIDEQGKPGGRIRVLEDSDGDGRLDRGTIFLEDVPFPTGVSVWRDGVLVCAAPDVLFARDTDGDGTADRIEKILTGFATHNFQARVNSLQFGLDNWMYASTGLFGGEIKSFTGNSADLTSRDFRFQPDSGQLEPVTGQTQQSRVRDDWDNWFGCDNGTLIRHYPVVDRYVRRNPLVAPAEVAAYVPDYPESNRLYPIASQLVTFQLSGPPGFVTAACGLGIYRDDLLGDEFYGNAFVCDPVSQVVHRLLLSPRGTSFSGVRAADEQQSEFLASTDNWFRPVQVRTGPDGALWVVDMYRYLIEHPMWIPPEVLATIDIRAGDTRGRIYRVSPRDRDLRVTPRLDRLESTALAQALESPNGTLRDLVQQMLVWRKAGEAAPELARQVRESKLPQVRAQALATLAGLSALEADLVTHALDDPHPGVRRQAIRLSEGLCQSSAELVSRVLKLVDDADPQVRLQLAYTLGEMPGNAAAGALLELAALTSDDPQLQAAVLSSVSSRNAKPLLQKLLATADKSAPPARMLEVLLGLPEVSSNAALRLEIAKLAATGIETNPSPWRFEVTARLLSRPAAEESQSAEKELITRILAAARTFAGNEQAEAAARVAAIGTLGNAFGEKEVASDIQLLTSMLSPRTPIEIQLASIERLARLGNDEVPAAWIAQWRSCSPGVRAALLDAFLSRAKWSQRLLSALAEGTLSTAEIDATRRQRLLNSADETTRTAAAQIFSDSTTGDRRQVIAGYTQAAAMPGDPSRGTKIFAKTCAGCHRLENVGEPVGPDLAPLAHKPAPALLMAILDPNQAVDPRYLNYLAITDDGRQYTGLLTAENASSVTLVAQDNKQHTLLRGAIEELASSGKSLMPEGLEKEIDPAAMADLLAYLAKVAEPPKVFEGNRPAIVRADAQGRYNLAARVCEIRGPRLLFETEFNNLGFWSAVEDSATWTVDIATSGKYEVVFDYACHNDSAGNGFVLDTSAGAIRGQVVGTGEWSDYRSERIGSLKLAAGMQKFSLRAEGAISGAMIDLRGIQLLPKSNVKLKRD